MAIAPAEGRAPPNRSPAGAAVLREGVTQAIRRAVFVELARTGYASLSMEAVARRAEVGKAALYRRWPSKLPMVAELLAEVGAPLADTPDTGALEGDVRAFLRRTAALLRHPLVRRILPDLHAEMARTPALADAIRGGVQVDRRTRGRNLLRRAIDRGELRPGLDETTALDLLAAPLYWRLIVTGNPIPPGGMRTLVTVTVAGLRAC